LSHIIISSANAAFGSSIIMLVLLPKRWSLTLEIGSGADVGGESLEGAKMGVRPRRPGLA